MKMTKVLAVIASAAVAATAMATAASAASYKGNIAFQTASYSFRNGWSDAGYGEATDYYDSYIVWGAGDYPEETYPQYEDNFNYDINGYTLDATYTDATITGDGTYTISAEVDWSVTGDSAFNLIQISTDLPVDGSVAITNAKVIVDGAEQVSIDNPIWEGTEYMTVNLCNIWNTEVAAYTGAFPTKSLAVEFTVSGLGAAEAPAAGDVAADTDSTKGSPDTGIEDVAVVAGLAIVAAGAIAISRKRK
jgi:hypothetical protein